jgi:hypothetical protein
MQVEDARATLSLYKREQFAWEKYLRTNKLVGSLVGIAPPLPKETKPVDNGNAQVVAAGLGDEGSDSEGEFSGLSSTAKVVVPDSNELAITEFAE